MCLFLSKNINLSTLEEVSILDNVSKRPKTKFGHCKDGRQII